MGCNTSQEQKGAPGDGSGGDLAAVEENHEVAAKAAAGGGNGDGAPMANGHDVSEGECKSHLHYLAA